MLVSDLERDPSGSEIAGPILANNVCVQVCILFVSGCLYYVFRTEVSCVRDGLAESYQLQLQKWNPIWQVQLPM